MSRVSHHRLLKTLFLLFLLSCPDRLHGASDTLNGTLQFWKVFDGSLKTEIYSLSPTDGGEGGEVINWPISDDFSLSCSSCRDGAVTQIRFNVGEVHVVLVLADHVVSVVVMTDLSVIATQVVQLGESCTANTFIEFPGSHTDFAVECHSDIMRFGSLNRKSYEINLQPEVPYDIRDYDHKSPTILVTVDNHSLLSVVLTDEEFVTYNLLDGKDQMFPFNDLNCLDISTAKLIELNTRGAILLQCNTRTHGKTVYVISVPVKGCPNVTDSIQANGKLYSSDDGSFILVVNDTEVDINTSPYAAALVSRSSKPATRVVRLNGPVSNVTNLNELYVQLLTHSGTVTDLIILNLKTEHVWTMPGGIPHLHKWISKPSNHYVYVTQNRDVYVFNESFSEPVYTRTLANLPEVIVYLETTTSSSSSPSDFVSLTPTFIVSFSIPPSPTVTRSPNYDTIKTIVGSLASVTFFLFVALIIGISLLLAIRRRRRRIDSRKGIACSGRDAGKLDVQDAIPLVPMDGNAATSSQGSCVSSVNPLPDLSKQTDCSTPTDQSPSAATSFPSTHPPPSSDPSTKPTKVETDRLQPAQPPSPPSQSHQPPTDTHANRFQPAQPPSQSHQPPADIHADRFQPAQPSPLSPGLQTTTQLTPNSGLHPQTDHQLEISTNPSASDSESHHIKGYAPYPLESLSSSSCSSDNPSASANSHDINTRFYTKPIQVMGRPPSPQMDHISSAGPQKTLVSHSDTSHADPLAYHTPTSNNSPH